MRECMTRRRFLLTTVASAVVLVDLQGRYEISAQEGAAPANLRTESYRTAERAVWGNLGVKPREVFLELSRPRIRVRVQDLGSGSPVLFVHGVMTAGTSFASLVARMPGIRCLVLDRPGCGLSEPWELRGPGFRAEAIEVLSSVLDALKLEHVSLVGNSLGCLWAFWFALEQPARVTRIVQLGSSAGMPGVHVPLLLRILSLPPLGAVVARMMSPTRQTALASLRSLGHGPSIERGVVPDAFLDWQTHLMADTQTMRNELQILRRAVGLRGMQSWAMLTEQELRAVAVPTLFLSGDRDTHGGAALAEHIATLVPGAKLEILPGGGHLPWLDDAERVAHLGLRFLLAK